MVRILKYADYAQIPITVAAYIGAALWTLNYLETLHFTVPWQFIIVAAILLLGFAASTVQVLALRGAASWSFRPTAGNSASALKELSPDALAAQAAVMEFRKNQQLHLFDLGMALGKLKQFDSEYINDLHR
jgi:hypothetical protein